MRAVFVRKAFENATTQPGDENPAKQIQFIDVSKFVYCVFNWFAYDWEISGPLTASSFLGLLKY